MIKVASALVIFLLLAGCGTSDNDPAEQPGPGDASDFGFYDSLREEHYKLKDGRDITCIVYKGNKKGGVSCDWRAK